MGTIETVDHTADVGLIVRAADLDDLFVTAAQGLCGYVIANPEAIRSERAVAIRLEADGPGELLLVWLGELIFRGETEHLAFGRFEAQVSPDGRSLEAVAHGEPIDPARHVLDHEVKAVTRHDFDLRRAGDGWVAELILDI